MVGNKIDLFFEEKDSKEEAMAFAEEINAKFALASTYDKESIDNLFQSIGEELLSSSFNKLKIY